MAVHEVARPSRNPERSSPSSTIFYFNYVQKTTRFILTIYGTVWPLVLMCRKAIIQSTLNPDKFNAQCSSAPGSMNKIFCRCTRLIHQLRRSGVRQVRILGVTLLSSLTFDKHVVHVCKACKFHMCVLRHIRSSLTDG